MTRLGLSWPPGAVRQLARCGLRLSAGYAPQSPFARSSLSRARSPPVGGDSARRRFGPGQRSGCLGPPSPRVIAAWFLPAASPVVAAHRPSLRPPRAFNVGAHLSSPSCETFRRQLRTARCPRAETTGGEGARLAARQESVACACVCVCGHPLVALESALLCVLPCVVPASFWPLRRLNCDSFTFQTSNY